MKEKLYPFSARKHAHDIEFRRNRAYIEMREYEDDLSSTIDETYYKLCELYDNLTDLLQAVLNSSNGVVCFLTGKQIALAKECVAWAECRRASTIYNRAV